MMLMTAHHMKCHCRRLMDYVLNWIIYELRKSQWYLFSEQTFNKLIYNMQVNYTYSCVSTE